MWSPSGLWGDSDTDVIWVVDTTHFGVHPLKLSELQAGVVERHVAPNLQTLDLRMIQGCHFTRQHSGRNGNYELSAIWGDDETIWVANGARGRLDAYQRVDTEADGVDCEWNEITAWDSYDTEQRSFRSGLPRNKSKDYSLWLTNNDYINVNGIWSDGATIWLSGPVARVAPNASPPLTAGIYKLDMSSGRLTLAPGYADLSDSAGIWSDGTTIWVATPGRLKAYSLANGARRANLDVGLHWGRDPGDIWSTVRRSGHQRRAERDRGLPPAQAVAKQASSPPAASPGAAAGRLSGPAGATVDPGRQRQPHWQGGHGGTRRSRTGTGSRSRGSRHCRATRSASSSRAAAASQPSSRFPSRR